MNVSRYNEQLEKKLGKFTIVLYFMLTIQHTITEVEQR
ncbi:hypothetical protein COXBURSA331_0021 (plasmid) [Coxiella burnetii RSA 331]|nr:hypothetical protein COXBURSA331_0021 [Coxiella burnetii RSA 331]EAX32553.1 hypothetical protein A35_0039 [Coxiella burnetii 'MSU Goat Q177']